jgi:hypothetical protein
MEHNKPIFETVPEALLALSLDKLGTVYFSADKVHVITAHGIGTFSRVEWLAGSGPGISCAEKDRPWPGFRVIEGGKR